MKKLINILIVCFIAFYIYSCNKKYDGDTSLENVKYNNNKKTYSTAKMDSAQAINTITKQKIQEFLDLSTLYASGNRDTEIDSVIYAQMQSYFVKQDSTNIKPLLKDLDSLKVRFAKVNSINSSKSIVGKDTLDFATYDVDYYNKDRKLIGNFNKNTQYILQKSPVKFKKEFKFYFVDFEAKSQKDSTSVGVTK